MIQVLISLSNQSLVWNIFCRGKVKYMSSLVNHKVNYPIIYHCFLGQNVIRLLNLWTSWNSACCLFSSFHEVKCHILFF